MLRSCLKWLNGKCLKEESINFNELAPIRRLTRDLDLTSHPKDGVINSEYKLHELVCYCLRHRNDSCTKGYCRGSNLRPYDKRASVLHKAILPPPPQEKTNKQTNKQIIKQTNKQTNKKQEAFRERRHLHVTDI